MRAIRTVLPSSVAGWKVHVRTEAGAEPGEPRDLPEIREELLDLALKLVHAALPVHLRKSVPAS